MRTKLTLITCSALAIAAFSAAVADETHKGHDHDATMKAAGEKHEHASAEKHEHASADPAIFTGEVIDLTCFTSHPETGSGPEHASCAKTCLEKGLPAGLLVGDRLYTIVMEDHSAPFKAFAAYGGQVVNATGVATESHGSWFLTVQSIEHAPKPASK